MSERDQSKQSPAEVLGEPLALRGGVTIKNRFMKSAMSEVLSDREHAPTEGLARLYRTWAKGGVGLSVTGNVMIDRRALGEPRNVVLEDERDMAAFRAWAEAGSEEGCTLFMQLNHPGKQSPIFLSSETVAPSAVPFAPHLRRAFAVPRALTEAEIEEIIARFATSAALAKEAGFAGVQVHAAHGYLVSQFLSPHHNRREDRWGGSLENRSRFALEVYRAIREAVGEGFPIGIKINSADFQKGGFTEEESLEVIAALAAEGMDLFEISGGNYESPAMTGAGASKRQASEKSAAREAYFLRFAERVRGVIEAPLAVTGGFRSAAGMAEARASGAVDLIGLARPLAIQPSLPAEILAGGDPPSLVRHQSTGIKTLDMLSMLSITWYENQLARMAKGEPPDPDLGAWRSVVTSLFNNGVQSFQLRRAK